MRYYIIAGEASGDLHGSNLMRGLYAEDPQAVCRFWGGGLMNEVFKAGEESAIGPKAASDNAVAADPTQAQGGLVQDYADGAMMGFKEILLHLGGFLGRFKRCCEDILAWKPDVVILIDYPGFNFRVAEFAHRAGFKVFYYIAPKVWASREGRVRKLRAFVDQLFIVFPFEKDYFTRKGIPFIYKGNPLLDAVDNASDTKLPREDFFGQCHLPPEPYIAILAGSRKGEISTMMPVCMEFADRLRRVPKYSAYRFVIAGAPSRSMKDYEPWLQGRESYVSVVFGRTYGVLKNAEAAVINSGTASLEACLIGVPQVVGYSSSDINFNLALHIIHIDCISLGNLILGRKAFRELLQYYFTPENLLSEVLRLLEDGEYREKMLSDYAAIRSALGGRGASRAVAKAMVEELIAERVGFEPTRR